MQKKISIISVLLLLATGTVFTQNHSQIRFGLCTDVHLPTMHDSEYRITTFIDSMKIAKPDFILEMGDFGTPEKKYAPLFDIWNSFPGPKYHVIGNHEMDGGTTLDQAVKYLKIPRSYYSFNNNGFHFIVLDGNNKKTAESKGYKQFIGPDQISWLINDLAKTKYPVVIFSHQGLAFIKGAEEGYGVENYAQVQEILQTHNAHNPSKKVIACFNGHSHFDYAEELNGIWYITITSMAYHWLGDNYVKIRYSDEIDKNFKWIKYTAPIKEPLFTVVEISTKGYIKISGKKSEWVGPSPWELGYPEELKKYIRPAITGRYLEFKLPVNSTQTGNVNPIELKVNDLLDQMTLEEKVDFQAGRLYDIKVEFYENIGSCTCKLGFAPFDSSDNLKNAVKLANESELVVLCLGLNKELEGESTDREDLALPLNQAKLLDEIVKANPKTIVVLNNATPIIMTSWIDKVPAVIEAFYPGQEGGNALADILFGDVNPSGKLPITFMKRWEDSPAYGTYPGTKKIADYKEGIFVGYRHFDKYNIDPLFPFGYGLSYTTFKYTQASVDKPVIAQNDTLTVNLTIKNTGKIAGDEVVQLYIHDKTASVERELKSLKRFVRINLKTGESKTVSFKIDKNDLSFYDTNSNKWIAEPGEFEVMVGSSSRDIRTTVPFKLK